MKKVILLGPLSTDRRLADLHVEQPDNNPMIQIGGFVWLTVRIYSEKGLPEPPLIIKMANEQAGKLVSDLQRILK